jgi:hypothetical protein
MPPSSRTHAQHPNNAPGPFYVVDGCCTLCGVPEYAPTLFELDLDQGNHCWVKKQPTTALELDEMLKVIAAADLGCIRYRGKDLDIIERLRSMNEADKVDTPGAPERSTAERHPQGS